MRRIVLCLMLAICGSFVVPAYTQPSSNAAKSARSQARDLRKAQKRQQKATKKYAKAQKKAERKMLKTERKNSYRY